MRKWIAILLLLPLFSVVMARAALQPEMIRVALIKNAEAVSIDGTGLLVTDSSGDPIRASFPLEVRKSREGMTVNGKAVRGVVASAPAWVSVSGKRYRGTVQCMPDSKGILVVNELPLEEYLIGLINCEISSQWPMESVKAQAVIARTYALYQKRARRNPLYDLESSVMDQVYDGCEIEDARAARGVQETAGEVLTYNGALIQAFYHSNCGGHTEAAENVWGSVIPYLQGVPCRYCQGAPSLRWEQSLPLKKIEAQLRSAGFAISGLREIEAGSRNRSGRLNEVGLITSRGRQSVPAAKFRMAVGSTVIKSTGFDIRKSEEGTVAFSGIGYGHGVGLCQWGAKQRAADGFEYREILDYYYPGTTLKKFE